MTYSRDVGVATRCYDMEVRASGDGHTLEGYVAVFNSRTRVPDRNGDFEEIILPGFADRSLREHGFPTMQFDHGKDSRTGSVPIGVYEAFDRDRKGYAVRGRLFDNPIVEPIRQAIAGGAIKGMSFRFQVTKNGGDRWERRASGMDLRHVIDADVPEAGPVTFPAYAATSVNVRALADTDLDALIDEIRARTGRAIDLTDLTGQSRTWSAGGGDPDGEPREGDTSRKTARSRALEALRQPLH